MLTINWFNIFIRKWNITLKHKRICGNRSKKAVENADIVLLVYDGEKVDGEYEEIAKNPKTIKVFNKADIKNHGNDVLSVSAKTGENVEKLKEVIYEKIKLGNISSSDVMITNARHIDCLNRALQSLDRANEVIDETLDCISLEIREGWQALGEITGATANEEVVNRIFEKFCVGK